MLDKAHSRILIDRHYVGIYTYMLRFISLNDILTARTLTRVVKLHE